MKQVIAELHTHTVHSDGNFTVAELLETARQDGIACLALTDHNTCSGSQELELWRGEPPIPVIQGMEWTTYFGHMLVLGAHEFVDWREATPDTIDDMMGRVKAAGGIIGIAHPFVLGTPFCTGGHWDFNVQDWSLPSYIEIWSEADPANSIYNRLAYDFWLSLLGQGYHLAITHGKDWHEADTPRVLDGFTILYLPECQALTPDSALAALAGGRTAVSCGPSVSLQAACNGVDYTVGDTVPPGEYELVVLATLKNQRQHLSSPFGIELLEAELVTQAGTAAVLSMQDGKPASVRLSLQEGFVLVVLKGKAKGRPTTLAITSPIYIA